MNLPQTIRPVAKLPDATLVMGDPAELLQTFGDPDTTFTTVKDGRALVSFTWNKPGETFLATAYLVQPK